MKIIYAILLSVFSFTSQAGTSFTEFYCNSTGTNVNAGSTTNAAATFSDANGNWDATTGIFICSGVSDLSAVNVGDWASVFTDGATTAVFVGRITAVVDATDTITVSVAIKTGTPPSTSATGRSIKVGGAWYGPYFSAAGTEAFPFNFANNLLTNTSLYVPRYNFKADRLYSVTNAMTHSSNGPAWFRGYTNTVGDGGIATIDGSAWLGAGFILFTGSGANNCFANFCFTNNGASGSTVGANFSGSELLIFRCIFAGFRGNALQCNGIDNQILECEAKGNNISNTTGQGGFAIGGINRIIRCISHDNTGANSVGFLLTQGNAIQCIADSNGGDGFSVSSTLGASLLNCDSYNNGGDGIEMSSASASSVIIENCNLVKNSGFGITNSGSNLRNGIILHCAFGSGTQANTGGDVSPNLGGIETVGTVTYAADVTPWVDPGNGDFRINLAAAQNTGRGLFLQTGASYGGTISYPDIGAAQSTNSGSPGAASVISYPMFRR